MSAEFSLPIRVYIEDTDAGGIVYYVNYLKYLERCRTEFMRALGTDRAAISDEGWMFVVIPCHPLSPLGLLSLATLLSLCLLRPNPYPTDSPPFAPLSHYRCVWTFSECNVY